MDTYVCGIATLTPLDMLTSKLLANSDRWNDDGVFNRDVIDLAMMSPPLPMLRRLKELHPVKRPCLSSSTRQFQAQQRHRKIERRYVKAESFS
jgi:hypothetical protein